MNSKSTNPLYLLLVRDPADGRPEPTSEQIEKIFAWFRALKDSGHLVAVSPLDHATGKVLRGGRSRLVTDGPFIESKEVVGGYVIVTAKNLTQAVALARSFPMFAARRSVEVRRIHPLAGTEYPAV